MRKYAVEFVGTTLLVLVVVGAALSSEALAPLAIGAGLMALVYAGAHVSGAHYNPAISVAIWLRGRLSASEVLPYWAAQLLGALVAGALSMWLFESNAETPLNVAAGQDLGHALVLEGLFTFALAWVVLNTATSRAHEGNNFYGLAIGFTVLAGVVVVGEVSGAAFNPAVAFGLSVAGLLAWPAIWVYVVANLAGAAAAAYTFKLTNPERAGARPLGSR